MLRTSDPGGYTSAMSKRGLDIASLTPEERLDLLEGSCPDWCGKEKWRILPEG